MYQICFFYRETRLVPYSEEYDQQTVLWLNDPELRQNFGFTGTVTLDSHRQWIAAQNNLLMWSILDVQNVHHGNILLQLNKRHASAYLQIYIGNPEARGRGMGWNAMVCVLNYAFNLLRLNRVWLHLDPKNKAAAGLYNKAGFVIEGVEREAVFRNGVYTDQLRLSILAKEWQLSRMEVSQ